MQNCTNISQLDTGILSDSRWNREEGKSLLMHSIHVYPAKFPPFIAEEAFQYAQEQNVHYEKVADIFCGCGTVALEAKRRGVSFWGCDINPVAVLIARAKTNTYDANIILEYSDLINLYYKKLIESDFFSTCYGVAPERLKYWFTSKSYQHLYCLKAAIVSTVKEEDYKTAFLCIFSSILKNTSKWLQKSIKPQVDPNKKEVNVKRIFDFQVKRFIKAVKEINDLQQENKSVDIKQADFLRLEEMPNVDLIITSPPYVTSYEYADLHQLTSLWLGYTDDYRKLRNGSIGSSYNSRGLDVEAFTLNATADSIINDLKAKDTQPARMKAIARYYSDMENVIEKCSVMLNRGGMAVFVIGDSELKGVKLFNSKHLVESMITYGFTDIMIGKRTIEKSMCVPFRNTHGRFTKQSSSKNEIYHEEYVVSGRIE